MRNCRGEMVSQRSRIVVSLGDFSTPYNVRKFRRSQGSESLSFSNCSSDGILNPNTARPDIMQSFHVYVGFFNSLNFSRKILCCTIFIKPSADKCFLTPTSVHPC